MSPWMHSALELAITLVAAMVCIIPHEVSHGYAAYRLGDPTAKNAGRLTMNPLRHIDPVGLLGETDSVALSRLMA